MKNNFKFLLITTVVAIIGLVVIGGSGIQADEELASLIKEQEVAGGAVAGAQAKGEASLVISYGEEKDSFTFQVDAKTTAYDLLSRASIRENIILDTREFAGVGIIVDGIGQYQGGQDDKYWILYVNGEMGLKSIDKTLVKPGNKVELKFEASPF